MSKEKCPCHCHKCISNLKAHPDFPTGKDEGCEHCVPPVDLVSNWEEKLRKYKEVILWKMDEKIKGLTKRYMYDADFVENFIARTLQDQEKRIIEAERKRVTKKYDKVIKWALGFYDFPERKEGEGAYWWRKTLLKKWNNVLRKENKE